MNTASRMKRVLDQRKAKACSDSVKRVNQIKRGIRLRQTLRKADRILKGETMSYTYTKLDTFNVVAADKSPQPAQHASLVEGIELDYITLVVHRPYSRAGRKYNHWDVSEFKTGRLIASGKVYGTNRESAIDYAKVVIGQTGKDVMLEAIAEKPVINEEIENAS